MRIESDSLGTKAVDDAAYYGIHTERARENFPVTSRPVDGRLVRNLILVKEACANANAETGRLAADKHRMIVNACEAILDDFDRFASDLRTPAIQGGAGTSTNMNANEVIANLAAEMAGAKKGAYELIHPNDDVNMAQSTNDVYPTAGHMALVEYTTDLLDQLEKTASSFLKLAHEHRFSLKMGRTQLEDAVPTTFGKEFHAYYRVLMRDYKRIEAASASLLEVPLGGTAIGTSICATQEYCDAVVPELRRLSGMPLTQAEDLSDAVQNTDCYVALSSAYKNLATDLIKITNDLRLLGSGPQAGLHELELPKVQAGSSIMPGKVNPVIPEVCAQVAFQVVGNDAAIALASSSGQLELNAFEPVMFDDLFEDASLLRGALLTLKKNCLDHLKVNEQRCAEMAAHSAGLATALSPAIGYRAAAKIAQEAVATGESIEVLLKEKINIPDSKIKELLNPQNLLQPANSSVKLETATMLKR